MLNLWARYSWKRWAFGYRVASMLLHVHACMHEATLERRNSIGRRMGHWFAKHDSWDRSLRRHGERVGSVKADGLLHLNTV